MKNCVVVPTYNESSNIEKLITEILAQEIPGLSIIIVDDHSPDQTAKRAAALSEKDPRIHVLERMNQRGRGTAGILGIEFAMQIGADTITEMDADFSHPPGDLRRLLVGLEKSDISIASRLCPDAKDYRPFSRRLITWFANRYARFFLELVGHSSKVKDWTTGFRSYRRNVFETIPPSTLASRGPSILQEVLFRALNAGATASEIPIVFRDRKAGRSKFSRKTMLQSLLHIPCYRILYPSKNEYSIERFSNYSVEKPSIRHYELRKTIARPTQSAVKL